MCFYLDSTVGSASTYKPQGSKFDTRLHQLNIWLVQLEYSELYGKLLEAEIRSGTPTQQ